MNKKIEEIISQLRETWSQIGLNQKISVVLAAAVVLIGLAATAFFTARTGYTPLARNMSDEQNAKVIAMLGENKVPYRIVDNGSTIEVPSNQVHLMKMKLAEKRIPMTDGKGWGIFDEPNIGASETILRINRVRALQEELAMTIRQFDDVESARVVLTMPENRLLLTDNSEPTAAVFTRLARPKLSDHTVNAIQFLVANAVEGLDVGNVSVMDNTGVVLAGAEDQDSVAGMASSQLEARKQYEDHFTRRIQKTLDMALGPRKSIVNVFVELNTDTVQQTELKHDPESQVAMSETTTEEITSSLSGDRGPGAGVSANINATTNAPANFMENSGSTNKVTNKQYAVDKTTSTLLQSAGGVKRISAAVMIDMKYMTDTNGIVQIQPRSVQEIDKLKKHVQMALGINQTIDVTLEEMEFNTKPIEEMTLRFEQTQDRQFYLDLAKQALYMGLPVLFVFLFIRMLKKTHADDIPLGIAMGLDGDDDKDDEDEDEMEPGVVSVDVLNRLLRENPENMTQAVRSWLNEEPKNN